MTPEHLRAAVSQSASSHWKSTVIRAERGKKRQISGFTNPLGGYSRAVAIGFAAIFAKFYLSYSTLTKLTSDTTVDVAPARVTCLPDRAGPRLAEKWNLNHVEATIHDYLCRPDDGHRFNDAPGVWSIRVDGRPRTGRWSNSRRSWTVRVQPIQL